MHKQLFKENISRLITLLDDSSGSADTSQAAVAQYACVSGNGYLEKYFKYSMIEKYRDRCDEKSLKIIKKMIGSYFNFKSSKVISFFQELWPDSVSNIEDYFKSNGELSDALGSIVANKNTIAHEGHSTVSITRVKPWLISIYSHLDELDNKCFG